MHRVLLVDDEPIIRSAFRKIIPWEDAGFEIIGTASNGQEALRLLEQHPADVVITDLKMPQMDGISLIKALKSAGFTGVILVLSNYADFELVREALVAGAMDYMLKVNIDADNLTAKLGQAREALAARHKHQREENLVAEHSALVRAHALRAFLTEGKLEAQALKDAYTQGPFGLCHIALQAGTHPPSAQHVESVLRTIFEDVRDTDIIILGERALLCVYPLASLAAKGIRQEGKLNQIARQVNMYFNAPVLIITAPPVGTLSGIRAQSMALSEAAALAFYTLPTQVVSLHSVAFGAVPDEFIPAQTAKQLAEAHFMNDGEAIKRHITSFFDACRAARTHPQDVAAFLRAVADHLLAFTPDARADAPEGGIEAWSAYSGEQQLYAQATALFEKMLAQIIPPGYAHCKEEVRKALLYVHVHYRSRITLSDVARAANLDRSYLCRLFKRETGINLFAYLNALRMNAAARMIEKGDVYIREVSGLVGIDDPFYFTRLFKKHFGVSPSEYGHGQ